MEKASRTPCRILCALLVAGVLAGAASASEFKSHKKPDPKRFAEGVAAYDARNFTKAYDIWLPLARHGDLAALFNIGLMLRDGRGIPQDLPRALSFFGQCAKQEHLGCQVNLADMYYKGIGTKQNYAEAARLLMEAARRGHYPSMYKLAGMFERGQGVEANLKAAKVLYATASEGGYPPARRRPAEPATGGIVGPGEPAPAPLTTAPLPPPPTLRGTLGMNESDGFEPADSAWGLRASLATRDPLEMVPETIDIGGTDAVAGGARPRICRTDPEAFDAHPSMCRMPPVRN